MEALASQEKSQGKTSQTPALNSLDTMITCEWLCLYQPFTHTRFLLPMAFVTGSSSVSPSVTPFLVWKAEADSSHLPIHCGKARGGWEPRVWVWITWGITAAPQGLHWHHEPQPGTQHGPWNVGCRQLTIKAKHLFCSLAFFCFCYYSCALTCLLHPTRLWFLLGPFRVFPKHS